MESLIEKILADKTLLGAVVALAGLLGVVLGSLLNATTQWLFQLSKTKKEAEYLAIRVSFMLDRFVRECVPVAYDDGHAGGRSHDDEHAVARTTCPLFDPEKGNSIGRRCRRV